MLNNIKLQTSKYIENGITLQPTKSGLSDSAILYRSEEADILDILLASEIDEITITKAPKTTLTHLQEALWAGFTFDDLPVKWSKSTKWL